MKRNWDLIRTILFKVEEQPTMESVVLPSQFQSFDEETVSYHIWLLREASLIEASCRGSSLKRNCFAKGLTWEGHEFLDKIRSDDLWKQTASTIKTKGLELSFDSIKATSSVLMKQMIGSL